MENQLENIPPDDQQPPGDGLPVAENGNTEPDPPAEITTTSALPVRVPTKLLNQLDNECITRGIARSELVREIFTRYYANKGKQSNEELQQAIDRLTHDNTVLKTANSILINQRDNKDQVAKAGLPSVHNYVAELENDLLKAVDMSCKAIMLSRSDFRKKLKHYGRLESGRA